MGVGTLRRDRRLRRRARVHRLEPRAWPNRDTAQAYYEFFYNAAQHDTTREGVHVPDLRRRQQDDPGAVGRRGHAGRHRSDRRRRAASRRPGRGWRGSCTRYFVNEVDAPDEALISATGAAPTTRATSRSSRWCGSAAALAAVHATRRTTTSGTRWPVGVRRARRSRKSGWTGFSVNDALNPMINMGQQLFEPPDVAGWELGPGWFSSGAMLARMNFAAQLATNQKFNLRDQSRGQRRLAREPAVVHARSADAARRSPATRTTALLDYARAGGAWTGSDTQLATKAAGPRAPDRRVGRLSAGVGRAQAQGSGQTQDGSSTWR